MRQILSMGCVLAIVAMSLVSCDKEPEEVKYYTTDTSGPTPTPEGFNQLTVSVPDGVGLTNGNNFTFTWATGDKFSVYEYNGEWVADLKIKDAAASVPVFAVEGDVYLDDETKYIAVYPARESGQDTYNDYLSAVESMSDEQTQIDDTYTHLKSESLMEVEFMGDNPIVFESKKVVTLISFELENTEIPALIEYNDGNSNSYTLSITVSKSTSSTKDSYTAYMLTNPVAASSEERTLKLSVSASDNTELIHKEIKTNLGFSAGTLCNINLEDGTVEVGVSTEGGDGGSDNGESTGGNNENLNPEEGTWL